MSVNKGCNSEHNEASLGAGMRRESTSSRSQTKAAQLQRWSLQKQSSRELNNFFIQQYLFVFLSLTQETFRLFYSPMNCWREWQPLISCCSHSWACIYRELPALKLPEENLAWFSSLSSSVGWNSSFLKFLAPACSALHLQFTGSCYSRMSWQLNTHIQMRVPLLGSTGHEQEVQGLLFTACPSPGRNPAPHY